MPRPAGEAPEPKGWEHRLTQQVGRNVRFHRERQGRKIVELSQATADLGHPLNRMVIGNLEGGHRESVTAGEIAVLAAALNVPPITLILPIGRAVEAEVLPGRPEPMSDAYRWIIGSRPLDVFQEDEDPAAAAANQLYNEAAHPIQYLSMHDRAYFHAATIQSEGSEDAIRNLWELRRVMALQGIALPPIGVEHVVKALAELDR